MTFGLVSKLIRVFVHMLKFQLRVHSMTPHPIGAWLDCPNIEMLDLAVGQTSRPREITQMQLKRCADVNP